MTSTSGLKLSDRSELQAREDRERKDRAGWYGVNDLSIKRSDHTRVCMAMSSKDRDLILTMARSYDAMREALIQCAADFISEPCTIPQGYAWAATEFMRRMEIARAALSLANGSKKETGEEENGGLRI